MVEIPLQLNKTIRKEVEIVVNREKNGEIRNLGFAGRNWRI